MARIIKTFNIEDYQRLLEFYKKIDKQYYPHLSGRTGGLQAHMLRNINNKGGFFLDNIDFKIVGGCGYRPLDNSKKVVEFNLFSYLKEFRKKGLPIGLIRYMINTKDSLGYKNVEKFVARTFYPESVDLLIRIGFNKIAEIENDLVKGRTSYYFKADALRIITKFKPKKTFQ